MTDHDRGAYTPQTDEALAFDARREADGRPLPMTLIGSGVVLAVLVVGIAIVYRGGVRNPGEAARPVGQPVVAVKTAPSPTASDSGAQPPDLPSSNAIATVETAARPPVIVSKTPPKAVPAATALAAPGPAAPSPSFAPPPEQPAPRVESKPKLALAAPPEPAPAVAKTSPVVSAKGPVRTVGGLDSAEVAAAGMTGAVAAKPVKAVAAPVKLAAAAPTAAPPPKTPPAAGQATGSVVQIGAFSSVELADKGYADASSLLAGQMAGKSKHVLAIQVNGATLYRTWVAGFASRTEATAFCNALKAKAKPCFVKG
jgi:cell division protein FtsN